MSHTARDLADDITNFILKPSKRDKQFLIGPSDLGDPCDRCLGLKMAERLPDGPRAYTSSFSLKAWLGTAVHFYLQKKLKIKGVKKEIKVPVFKLKGYGTIKGHIDVYGRLHLTVCDYKTTDTAKLRKYRALNKPPIKYLWQIMLYAYALIQAGYAVKEVMLFFIPRDNNDVSSIWAFITEYDEAIALKAIKRVKKIWAKVQNGQVETLISDSDCYQCNSYSRDVVFQ